MKVLLRTVFIITTLLLSIKAIGSHVSRVHVQATQVSEDTIQLHVSSLVLCNGGGSFNTAFTIGYLLNSCGDSLRPSVIWRKPGRYDSQVNEIPSTCSTAKTRCGSGSHQGFYYAETVLNFHIPKSMRCYGGTWKATTNNGVCCRTAGANMTGSSYLSQELEFVIDSTHLIETPDLSYAGVRRTCVGQPVTLRLNQSYNLDDSLVYHWGWPVSGNSYKTGYSFQNPFGVASVQLNSSTGDIAFTPTRQGTFYYIIEAFQYSKSTGKLVSRQLLEDFVYIYNCSNNAPVRISATSNGSPVNNCHGCQDYSICFKDTLTYSAIYADPDSSANLLANVYYSDSAKVFISTRYLGSRKDSIEVNLTIIPITQSSLIDLDIVVSDNICPYPGFFYDDVSIRVNGIYTLQEHTICRNRDWVPLLLQKDSIFNPTWTFVSGDPLDTVSTSTGFNATGTSGIIQVSPDTTTVYALSTQHPQCGSEVDTIEVEVVPDFNLHLSGYKSTYCYDEEVTINTAISGGGTPYFTTLYSSDYSNFPSYNPYLRSISFNIKEDLNVYLQVRSDTGCIRHDTVELKVPQTLFPDEIEISANDSVFCTSETVSFDVETLGYRSGDLSLKHGVFDTNQSTAVSYQSSGNSYVSNAPNIVRQSMYASRSQYLYSAAHFSGMHTDKSIKELSFYFKVNSGHNDTLRRFEIRLASYDHNYFPTAQRTFVSDTQLVYSAHDITLKGGWNTFVLDSAYTLHHGRNLVVDVVWLNDVAFPGNIELSGFNMSKDHALHYSANQPILKPDLLSSRPSDMSFLPAMRLKWTDVYLKNESMNFQWDVANKGLILQQNTDGSMNVRLDSSGIFDIVLISTDSQNVCTDTVRKRVAVFSPKQIKPPMDTIHSCSNSTPFYLFAPQPTSFSSGRYRWSGRGITHSLGLFYPSIADSGHHTFYYESDICDIKDTITASVHFFDPSFSTTEVCVLDSISSLNPVNLGGTWNGVGIFDSSLALLDQSLLPRPAERQTSSTLIIHSIDSLGCYFSATKTIKIRGEFDPRLETSLTYNPRYFCIGDPREIFLDQGGGLWKGVKGLQPSGFFDPQSPGNYIAEVKSTEFCGVSDTFHFVVPGNRQAEIFDVGPFCNPQPDEVIQVQSLNQGVWSANKPSGGGEWASTFPSVTFNPRNVVASNGYGNLPLMLHVTDTIYESNGLINVCTTIDSSYVAFVRSLDVDLGNDIYTCTKRIDTSLTVRAGGAVLWSTGAKSSSIRVTSPGIYWVKQEGYNGQCEGTDTITVSIDCASLDNNPWLSNEISTFPNPTQHQFIVRSKGSALEFIQVVSMDGKLVYSANGVQADSLEVDVSKWPAGVYSVIINTKEKTFYRKVSVY